MRVSTRVVVCTLAAAELPTTTHVRVGAPVEGLPGKNVCSQGTNTDQVCCSHSLTLSALDAQMVAPTVATCLGDYRRQNTYWSINGATTYIGGDDANNIDSRPCEFHAVITNPTIHSPLTCVYLRAGYLFYSGAGWVIGHDLYKKPHLLATEDWQTWTTSAVASSAATASAHSFDRHVGVGDAW